MAGSIVTCPNCGKRNRLKAAADGVPRCANCHELLPWLIDADPERFDEEIRASVPVLVDLWAPWCGPCRFISPLVEEAATANRGRLKVVKVNADDAPGLLERFGVRGIPTLIVFKNGQEADRLAGAAPKADLEAFLARHVEAPAPAG